MDRQINEILEPYTTTSSSRTQTNRRKSSPEIQQMLEKLENIPSHIPADKMRIDFVRLSEQSTPGDDYWPEGKSARTNS
jgi:hypothetical protein